MVTQFFAIERAAIEAIASQYPELSGPFLAQLEVVLVEKRTNAGAGFYTDFEYNVEVPSISAPSPIGEPFAEVAGLEHGMGFLLALRDGKMAYLEGYSFEEVTVPLAFETISFAMKSSPLQ